MFTGGAVRYRIYSAWGLTAIDVAKICFIAGLTFWLGNATVLGLGIAYEPQAATAIDQLPPWFNRIIAFVALGVLAGYVAWVWVKPRVIGRADWTVKLPGGPLTLLQIVIGIIDLACCALAMYVLLPDDPHIAFIKLAVIFVSATLLGFASHSPGGLGVFDAAMLVALIEFNKEQLLAGLLLFRLLYYIIPFALSLAILGVRELWLGRGVREIAAPQCRTVMASGYPADAARPAVRAARGDAPDAARATDGASAGSAQLLDAVIASLPDAAIVLDREGRVVAFNAAGARHRAGARARRSPPRSPCARPRWSRRCARSRPAAARAASSSPSACRSTAGSWRMSARSATRRRSPRSCWCSTTSRRCTGSRRCARTSSPMRATNCARRSPRCPASSTRCRAPRATTRRRAGASSPS